MSSESESKEDFPTNEKREVIFNILVTVGKVQTIKAFVTIISETPGEPKNLKVGSGNIIKIKNQHFIATAAHNLHGLQEATLVHQSNQCKIKIQGRKLNYKGGNSGDKIDVGYIELEEPEVGVLKVGQLTPESLGYKFNEGDIVYINGNPGADLKVDHNAGNIGIKHICATTCIKGVCNEDEMYLDYPNDDSWFDENGEPYVRPEPFGMSGGGIWATCVNKLKDDGSLDVWTGDDVKLIGIEHAWCKPGEYLVGTPIQHWINLIIEDYPHLKEQFTHLHPPTSTDTQHEPSVDGHKDTAEPEAPES